MEGTGSVLQCNTETKVCFVVRKTNSYQQRMMRGSFSNATLWSHCPPNSELPFCFGRCVLQMEDVFRGLDQCSEEEKLRRLQTLSLRYFTPREVANLMGFPQSFCKFKIWFNSHTDISLDFRT